jgi:acyl-CoA thioester hydrolase
VPYEFTITRRVEFSETDTAGIVHFSNFFRYMEAAEHAFFRSLGFSIHDRGQAEGLGWPRVHASCDFKAPLRFEDLVEIRLLVREKSERSLAYLFLLRKRNGAEALEVARGNLVVACVRRDAPHGEMKSVPIPREIADKIEVAPPELLG